MEMTAYMAMVMLQRVFVRNSNLPNDIFNRIKWNKRASQPATRMKWSEAHSVEYLGGMELCVNRRNAFKSDNIRRTMLWF